MTTDGKRQDYSKLISNAILDGKSADYVQSLYDSRMGMINADPTLEKYKNDDVMKRARDYINKNSTVNKAMDEYKNIYTGENSMYAQALANANKITDANVTRAVGDLESQKSTTNQSYANMFKQLYRDKKNSQKNINQQLAHQGITGGMSESTRLGLETSYTDALRQGEQERIKGISDLDRAITDVRLDGDIAKAQAAIDANNNAMSGYAAYLQTVMNRADADAAIKREQDANNKSYAYNYAMSFLNSGNMPTGALLDAAGISRIDAQNYVNSINAEKMSATNSQNQSYARQYALTMLQGGAMPSDSTLAAAGISKPEAESMYASYWTSANAKNKNSSEYTAFDDELKSVISEFASEDGAITADIWDTIKDYYPNTTENDLASMGFYVVDYYNSGELSTEKAQELYDMYATYLQSKGSISQMDAKAQQVQLSERLNAKEITPTDYNTIIRLIGRYVK